MKKSGFTLIELIIVLVIIFAFAALPYSAYFESKSYNKLTGANTTWWDAVFVELRVQDSTNK